MLYESTIWPGRRIDWEFEVWVPERFYRLRDIGPWQSSNRGTYQSLPAPRMTVYGGKDSPINWADVKMPANLTVIDKRVDSSEYRDSKGGVLKITVYDMATGRVLPSVNVQLVRGSFARDVREYAANTDDRGVALFKDVDGGVYNAALSLPAYATRVLDGCYNNKGRTLEVLDVSLAAAGSLSGTVVGPDGKPLVGITVEARETSGSDGTAYGIARDKAVTDKRGWFEIEGLPRGRAGDIYVAADGYIKATKGPFETGGENAHIVMNYAATIRGHVKGVDPNAQGGEINVMIEPATGARIGSWGGGMRIQADGSFEFKGFPADTYVITVKGRPSAEPKATVDAKPTKPGEVFEVEIE